MSELNKLAYRGGFDGLVDAMRRLAFHSVAFEYREMDGEEMLFVDAASTEFHLVKEVE